MYTLPTIIVRVTVQIEIYWNILVKIDMPGMTILVALREMRR